MALDDPSLTKAVVTAAAFLNLMSHSFPLIASPRSGPVFCGNTAPAWVVQCTNGLKVHDRYSLIDN